MKSDIARLDPLICVGKMKSDIARPDPLICVFAKVKRPLAT